MGLGLVGFLRRCWVIINLTEFQMQFFDDGRVGVFVEGYGGGFDGDGDEETGEHDAEDGDKDGQGFGYAVEWSEVSVADGSGGDE